MLGLGVSELFFFLFAILFTLAGIAIVAYILHLFRRFVTAVEKIAEKQG